MHECNPLISGNTCEWHQVNWCHRALQACKRLVAVVLGIDFSSTPHLFYGVKLRGEFGLEHSLQNGLVVFELVLFISKIIVG